MMGKLGCRTEVCLETMLEEPSGLPLREAPNSSSPARHRRWRVPYPCLSVVPLWIFRTSEIIPQLNSGVRYAKIEFPELFAIVGRTKTSAGNERFSELVKGAVPGLHIV